MDEFRVKVVEFSDRKFYMMQWTCPVTGRKKTRSTKVPRTGQRKDQTEAERVAAKLEADLREGRYRSPSKTTWGEFRERYEDEYLSGLKPGTADKVATVFNAVERILSPNRLRDMTEDRLSYYQAELRKRGLRETSIAMHLRHIKAALRWAEHIGLLNRAPKVALPKRAKGSKTKHMKGRPITAEEFERMLAKVPDVLFRDDPKRTKEGRPRKRNTQEKFTSEFKAKVVASWKDYLNGLWCSGLRLQESLELSWDRDDKLCIDLSGKHPMLRIPAELEKGNKDRLLPLAPEFAELVLRVPASDRTGYVFQPLPRRPGRVGRLSRLFVSKTVCDIGKAAGVKVHTDPKTKQVKYASAHDLRRSFGDRWSRRVMPTVLQELMRHEDVQTTLKYYTQQDAERTAEVLWEAHKAAGFGNTFGNTTDFGSKQNLGDIDQTSDADKVC